MICVGEAMRLVADALEQTQGAESIGSCRGRPARAVKLFPFLARPIMGRSCKPNRCNSRHRLRVGPFASTMIRSATDATKPSSVRQRCRASAPLASAGSAPKRLPYNVHCLEAFSCENSATSEFASRASSRTANTDAGRPRHTGEIVLAVDRFAPDNGGNRPCRDAIPKQTIEATTCVVEIFEISKHSITRGTCGSCSASAVRATSAIGSIVLGRLPRVIDALALSCCVNRQSCCVVRLLSRVHFLRRFPHFLFQRADHFPRFSFQNSTGSKDALAYFPR